jgi:hypothetical protein
MSVPTKPDAGDNALTQALKASRDYEQKRATMMGRGFETLTGPVGRAIAAVVPPELLTRALDVADKAAAKTLSGELAHDSDDLAACEAAALRVQKWAVGTNAVTGGAAGWFGGAGAVADIPATIGLAARTVQATAVAYGICDDTDQEYAFRLMVLDVATGQASENRDDRLAGLRDMIEVIQTPGVKPVMDKAGKWVTDKVVERISRQMGVAIASRKAGAIVPVVGAAVGAAVNASFQTDVARAARYAYRLRWLAARRLLPPVDGAGPDQ